MKSIKKSLKVNQPSTNLNKIHNLDCLELFKQMKEKNISVDALITDPPYSLELVNKQNFAPSVSTKWDDNFDQLIWIKESAPLVKQGGSVIIFNHWKNLTAISQVLEENEFIVKELIRWVKPNPLIKNITEEYTTDYELAIWAVKGEKWTFNFEQQLINNLKNKKTPALIPEYVGGVVFGEERIHPTQKNLQVIKDIIALHTNPGDLVLDPFMGSGTTAVACRELGRNFIGSELDKEYFQKASARLEKLPLSATEPELGKDDLHTLIAEIETHIKKLEQEITADESKIIAETSDYAMLKQRLLAKKETKKELEKIVQKWKMKLAEIVNIKNQEQLTAQIQQKNI